MTATLRERLGLTGTGYAAVINGVLDVRTVNENRNAVARTAFFAAGMHVMVACDCSDCDCECAVTALHHMRPDILIAAVRVEVTR